MESKLCVICDTEKSFETFYNKYREGKPSNIGRILRRYYANKDKLSDQRIAYYEKNRDVLPAKSKVNQQTRKPHTKQIKDLNNKVEEITQAMETLLLKIEKFLVPRKWHFLTIHIVKFAIDSLLKNDGINIFILVDICIEN